MAFATLTFDSQLLHRPVSVSVLLPENTQPKAVLTMLHGYTNGHGSTMQYSSLGRFCLDVPVAVVMPDAQCSFYLNTAYGQPYWDHISKEIPECLNRWLKLEVPKEHCFVAGISMGGYGAAKMALSFPESFAQAFLFSPVTDLADVARNGFDATKDPNVPPYADLHMDALLGGREVAGTMDDLYYLLDQAETAKIPEFTVYTGTEDFLYDDILRFVDALKQKGVAARLVTSSGIHCWHTWDPFLQQMAAQIAAAL